MFSNILIWFVVIPLLMLAGLALCRDIKQIRAVAVAGSTALIALSVKLLVDYLAIRAAGCTDPMLFTGSWTWFAPLHINLAVGVDGISVAMILLSSIIVFAGSFASWTIQQPKAFFLWLILLSTGVFGFFISIDLFTMFMFYEVALIPMYLLIGVWFGPQGVLGHEADPHAHGRLGLPDARPHRHLLPLRTRRPAPHLEHP